MDECIPDKNDGKDGDLDNDSRESELAWRCVEDAVDVKYE
jgi:hypothetical protein